MFTSARVDVFLVGVGVHAAREGVYLGHIAGRLSEIVELLLKGFEGKAPVLSTFVLHLIKQSWVYLVFIYFYLGHIAGRLSEIVELLLKRF